MRWSLVGIFDRRERTKTLPVVSVNLLGILFSALFLGPLPDNGDAGNDYGFPEAGKGRGSKTAA